MKMAGDGDCEGQTEYESDPEEAMMSLKMRRREASDDEDGEQVVEDREGEKREVSHHPRAAIADSEAESDGQGGAAEYDDEYEEEEEQEEYYDEQEEEVAEAEYEEREIGGGEADDIAGDTGGTKSVEQMIESGEAIGQDQGEEEKKKENEPFAVPTSGAFYMHDDRFRDNAGDRHRRTFGSRKLWESRDDRKWGHDKFEEMNIQDRHREEGRRSSKGYYRGRGKARSAERGYARGNRSRGYSGSNNQNAAPKDVKGRGPRRYQPSMKNKSEVLPSQNKQSAKLLDKTSHAGAVKISSSTTNPNAEHESVPAKKVASNLSSASPPFYPSSSSNKDVTVAQKKETQAGNHKRNVRPSVMDNGFLTPHSNSMWQGKNIRDSVGINKLNIDDSVSPAGARPLNVHLPSSACSPASANPMPPARGESRGIALSGSTMFQPPQTNNQVEKASSPATQALQRNTIQNQAQPSLQSSVHQVVQCPLGVSQGSSPPKTGKGTVQGAGRGSPVYGGAQVMGSGGNVVAGHGDQNLPAFLPVMQFGGQHPGGVGVPAVGMAFPGYVAQPNGLPNSEMTWLPVLASAAGALGATYCPPSIAVDGSYHPWPTGQTSALPAPSKDDIPSKSNNESKPQQRSEVLNHEFSQRQSKPRRYSEMNFSQ